MADLSPEDVIKARGLYMQGKVCNALAIIFALVGFGVFAVLYQKYVAPDPMAALRDISTLFIAVFPFLPAIALSMAAKRYEKRYLAMLPKE